MDIYKLSKPVIDGDETISELLLDFESLKTSDYFRAEKMVKLKYKKENLFVPETNKKFLAYIAAFAAKVTPETIIDLNLRDFCAITNLVSNFLLGGGLDTETEDLEDMN